MFILGHRGSPGQPRKKENTLFAFQKALNEGADGFECDVRQSADGVLVISAWQNAKNKAGGKTPFSKLSYSAIKKLRVDGEPIPTLDEALDTFASKACINLEIKERGILPDVMNMLAEYNNHNIIISSFGHEERGHSSNASWDELSAYADTCNVGLLATKATIEQLGDMNKLLDVAEDHRANYVHLQLPAVTKKSVKSAHTRNIKVIVWTVNRYKDIERMHEWGVDGIISDTPWRGVKYLRESESPIGRIQNGEVG